MKVNVCFFGVCGLLALSCIASAQTRILTFDELPSQPVDNVSIEGVTFHYTKGGSPSADALYNIPGLGTLTYLDDPVLEGDATGVLTFDFDTPTSIVDFGVARSSIDSLVPGAEVSVFDTSLQLIGAFSVNTDPLIIFSEGLFQYSGSPAKRVQVTFPNPSLASSFALDNLTFEAPAANVPEPGTVSILAASIVAASTRRFRRKSVR